MAGKQGSQERIQLEIRRCEARIASLSALVALAAAPQRAGLLRQLHSARNQREWAAEKLHLLEDPHAPWI